MEFSHAILSDNKPAGLLTLLDEHGNPRVSPKDTLAGRKIVDVNGWAPTTDGLSVSRNKCADGAYFSGYEWVPIPEDISIAAKSENDAALQMLVNGNADAMWVYADQAYNYDCSRPELDNVQSQWDCDLWSGLGTKFAYIHTGLHETSVNGTTLAMSKKGSGIAAILNPCIDAFLKTESYYNICVKHGLVSDCFKNSFFESTGASTTVPWNLDTNEQVNGCASGYCGCD